MKKYEQDEHFKHFAKQVENAIAEYGYDPDETLAQRQKQQIEKLVALESEFRYTLINHKWGANVYKDFVSFICDTNRNILSARPYFRERQTTFSEYIAPALKVRNACALYNFNFNTQFILFVMDRRKWAPKSTIRRLAQEIQDLRKEMVETNLPLAISRARLFWNRTPESQLSYMDLVQIASEGLLAGIDKYVLPYGPAFRHMVIGRMVGNFIDQYSETLMHFYPLDRKKIYRANKALARSGDSPDYKKVVEKVNEGTEPSQWTTENEIRGLMAAATSIVSAETPATHGEDEEEEGKLLDNVAAPLTATPEKQMEEAQAQAVVSSAIRLLTRTEQKYLALKGIAL